MTFERRVAVTYLARLLIGATAVEFDGRRVERIAFQQAPAVRVDDLVVTASREDGMEMLELAMGVRRAPAFTTSDDDTKKLLGDFITTLETSTPPGVERRLAFCVAGPQLAAQQVSQLASLARSQATGHGFFDLVRTPRRFQQPLVDRLSHLVNLVAANLKTAGGDDSGTAAELMTWRLLERLHVLMPRLEPPDESDWVELVNHLEPWAREPTIAAAGALRDRLESLAAGYAPAAAVIDLPTLRRDAHNALNLDRRRRDQAWAELRRIDSDARQAVRSTVGLEGRGPSIHLSRAGAAAIVRSALRPGGGVLVSGESGVGKSALVIGELTAVAAVKPSTYEVVFLNLRLLPDTMIELRDALGTVLDELLAEMSCPTRIVVIDAADFTIERDDHLLGQLLNAARSARVTPWVVSATDGYAAVRAVMEATIDDFREITIPGLEDAELEEVAQAFPHLRRLVDEPRAKELLRRPAIIDLFVRSGSSDLPLTDADALDIVWAKLVRNDERTTRGTPDARDQVMRQLALQQLRRADPPTIYGSLDPAALAGLQHDALLRPTDRWQPLPTFSHELLRTYAVARVLLSLDDPVAELIKRDAPRWALPATRLALQTLFAAPDTSDLPIVGRLARLQASVDRLSKAGHGDRWADLPSEALLTLPRAGEVLGGGWQSLLDHRAAGLRRLLRVIQQRHGRTGIVDPLIAEPVVELLLEHGWPSSLRKEVDELLRSWLCALIVAGEPAGNPLRIALRDRLGARVAAGDEQLAEMRREQAARLAARTPEQIAEDAARKRSFTPLSIGGSRRRRPSRELPVELTHDAHLEQLALLGADIEQQGEALLRRVASDAPQRLAPAVEEVGTGGVVASYSPSLLIDLVEAYYVDEDDEDGYHGMGDDGIRDHRSRGESVLPLAACYRGPFLAMLRADLRAGVACLNRLLNHAARARVQILRRLYWGEPEPDEDRYFLELAISGERRRYIGDGQVWLWYRGTGVGPYPCMSALQALELVCDEYLQAGATPVALVRLLLDGCENLAMPALLVGMLVRHLERVDTELDPFLAEPAIWHLEFGRTVHEHSGLAARNSDIVADDRRTWNLRDVSARLALRARGERVDALRNIGRRLVTRALELETEDPTTAADDVSMSEEIAAVRGWAGSLDLNSYKFTEVDKGYLIEQVIDDEVSTRLASSNADLARGNQAIKILFRYPERFDRHAERRTVTLDELTTDLRLARELADDPPAAGPGGPYDAPAAAAAAALEARYLDDLPVPEDDLVWAASLLVGFLNGLADQGVSEDDYSLFGQGPDRAAARALPLLELPEARQVRHRLTENGMDAGDITRAVSWIVGNGSNESRLFLARGFDPIWGSPCDVTAATCHHTSVLAVVEDIARDSLIGRWDPEHQQNTRLHIDGPVASHLQTAEHDRVHVPRLSPTIRGAAAASVSNACCKTDAMTLLHAALIAHRRGMHAAEHGYHHSDNDALVAVRAVLDVAAGDDDSVLSWHIDDYADDARLLTEFLRSLVAAGEETPLRAATARRVWPWVIDHVLDLIESCTPPGGGRDYEWSLLAALMPSPSYESVYLHREYAGEPIRWPDPVELAPQIERWLPVAAGHREPVDALAHLLYQLAPEQQATVGLPWMEQLVIANPDEIANRSYLLPEWLERVGPHTTSSAPRAAWHRIVDAMTVAGDHGIARLAD